MEIYVVFTFKNNILLYMGGMGYLKLFLKYNFLLTWMDMYMCLHEHMWLHESPDKDGKPYIIPKGK